jgi:hypothetical protein
LLRNADSRSQDPDLDPGTESKSFWKSNIDPPHWFKKTQEGRVKISSVVVLEHYKPIRVRLFGGMLIYCRKSTFQQKFITNDSLFTLCRDYVACGE